MTTVGRTAEGADRAPRPRPSPASADDRLRRLLVSLRDLGADVPLPELLRRLVEVACELVGARYGALGVVGPGGRLDEFVTVGVDAPTAERIGHLPRGDGLLGHLVDHPRPLRLDDLTAHPSSIGLPPGHPPMRTFLGAPVRVRGEVFGNLYLTDKQGAGLPVPFSAEDEELLVAMASAAGVVIADARSLDVAERRQRWLRASADVVQDLLLEEAASLAQVARHARRAAGADLGTVLVVDPDGPGDLQLVAADGGAGDRLLGTAWPREGSLVGRVLEVDEDVLVDDLVTSGLVAEGLVAEVPGMPDGPALVVRLPRAGAAARPGALVLLRRRGSPVFDEEDRAMASDFARHVGLALEMQRAVAARRRLALLDERERIARDLHDHVIQQVFATGLRLTALAGRSPDPAVVAELRDVVAEGDETIRALRAAIFALEHEEPPEDLLSAAGELVREYTGVLGFRPSLAVDEPFPACALPPAVAAGARAALRELLSNVARHAGASRASVHLAAPSGRLEVIVADDGVGTATAQRRSGLRNLEQRARELGGRCAVASPVEGGRGTRVSWSVPLPGGEPGTGRPPAGTAGP